MDQRTTGRDIRYRVVYYVQYRFEEYVNLDPAGKVLDAGPLLRVFKGRNIRDIRQAKMIAKIEEAPLPEPRVILTD